MASELASVIQSAHIQHEPSIEHDVNPSTAASAKIPAEYVEHHHNEHHDEDLSPKDHDALSIASSSTLPSDILQPIPRQGPSRHRMPLPDLRFEQTYLASIQKAETRAQVIYITFRDQVLLPLVQGVGYHLLISGWRYWNRGSQFAGETIGARVRKWWWGVNGWRIPEEGKGREAAWEVKDFYVSRFSSGGD